MHYNDCPTFHWDFLSDAQNRREDNGIDDRFQLERIDDTTLGAWLFSTSNSIWSEHGINDPLCQNWALSAFVLTDLSWNEPLPALESDCWCRFAQQRNLFFANAFSDRLCSNISRASLRPNIWQISRGLLSLVSTTPIIASDEVWCTDNVEQLLASLQPRGSVRFAAVSWEKDHFSLFLCRAFVPHISEYWTRIQEPYVCIYVLVRT